MTVSQTEIIRSPRTFREYGWIFTMVPLCLALPPSLVMVYFGGTTALAILLAITGSSATLGAGYLLTFSGHGAPERSLYRPSGITIWAVVSAALIVLQAILTLILDEDVVDPLIAGTAYFAACIVLTCAGVRLRTELKQIGRIGQ